MRRADRVALGPVRRRRRDGLSGGFQGCAGLPPEAANSEVSLQPGSTTYGGADATGDGKTTFIVQSDESNASLGCSATVACTLEVIPIEGISCDAAGTAPAPGGMPPADQPPAANVAGIFSQCASDGQYAPGTFNSNGQVDTTAVTGQYWWSGSNWRNRIAVPLSFAVSADVCNGQTNQPSVELYGSETLVQATQQWSPAFCLNPKLFSLHHVQTSEPEAKGLLSIGNIEAAIQAGPPSTPFAEPVVQAPTAVSGFAIAFDVDGADGQPYPQLRLDARLLAKLLTESYEACALDCLHFPALASNPIDVTRDPEFQALNPDIPPTFYLPAAAALSFISSDSDVMTALTAYINDDPEARAWLDGRPDPWGMVVNPAYEGIQLPVASWPLLDTHDADLGSGNQCLQADPSPWLPLVAAPIENPAQIAENLQFDIANAQVACANGGSATQKLVALGREIPGSRFVLGVVSLADAERYGLATAELETQRTSNDAVVFTSSAGRTFAAATDASLKAAAAMLEPDDSLGTWPIPYDALRTQPAGRQAYPGILLISTDVPTTGLPAQDAQEYAQFLRFVATTGQLAGLGNGQLPPGYLPLTAANGLSSLANYTERAADAVAAQKCARPLVSGGSATTSCPAPSGSTSFATGGSGSGATGSTGSTGSAGSSNGATSTGTVASSAPTAGSSTARPTTKAGNPSSGAAAKPDVPAKISLVATDKTTAITAGPLGFALPALAALGLLALGGSAWTRWGRR